MVYGHALLSLNTLQLAENNSTCNNNNNNCPSYRTVKFLLYYPYLLCYRKYVTLGPRRLGGRLCDWHVIKITALCISFELRS